MRDRKKSSSKNVPSSKKLSESRAVQSDEVADFFSQLGSNASSFERELGSALRLRPFVACGVAAGLGMLGALYLSSRDRSQERKNGKASPFTRPVNFDTEGSAWKLFSEIEASLDSIRGGRFDFAAISGEKREKLASKLRESPIETLFVSASLGFSLARVPQDKLRAAAIRFGKGIAIRALQPGFEAGSVPRLADRSEGRRSGDDFDATH
jgi:hypothetical protein